MKKIALLLSIIMVLGAFSGCLFEKKEDLDFEIPSKSELSPEKIGDYGSLKLPIDKKGTKIEMLCNTDVTTNNDSVVIKELRRRTGLNVQIIAVPPSAYKEKAKVLIAAKEAMPDLLHPNGFTMEAINDLGMQGAFANILDYIDELPNLKKIYVDEAKERGIESALKNMKAPDGSVFMYPIYDISRDVNNGMLYRKDIFDKHGIELWTDPESFLDVLRKLKELYPDSTPYASKSGINIFKFLGYSWGINGFNPYYDEETKTWKYSCEDPKFKEVIDLLKTMYNEGLADPEFLTATQAAWTSKMTQKDKAFVTWDWIGRLDMFKEQTLNTVPEYDLRYYYPIGGKLLPNGRSGSGSAVKKGENELLAMKLCDYLLSDSGAQLITMGVEGVTYNLRDDGKAEYIGFEGKKGVGINELESKYGLYISGVYKRFDRRSSYYDFTEKEQEAQDLINNKPGGGYLEEDPVLSFNAEEKEVKSKYEASISKAAEEFTVKYVLNEKYGDKEWEEWLKKAKTLGTEEVLKAYNNAQVRYDQL